MENNLDGWLEAAYEDRYDLPTDEMLVNWREAADYDHEYDDIYDDDPDEAYSMADEEGGPF